MSVTRGVWSGGHDKLPKTMTQRIADSLGSDDGATGQPGSRNAVAKGASDGSAASAVLGAIVWLITKGTATKEDTEEMGKAGPAGKGGSAASSKGGGSGNRGGGGRR